MSSFHCSEAEAEQMLQPLERPSGQEVESKATCHWLLITHLYYGRLCSFEMYNTYFECIEHMYS